MFGDDSVELRFEDCERLSEAHVHIGTDGESGGSVPIEFGVAKHSESVGHPIEVRCPLPVHCVHTNMEELIGWARNSDRMATELNYFRSSPEHLSDLRRITSGQRAPVKVAVLPIAPEELPGVADARLSSYRLY